MAVAVATDEEPFDKLLHHANVVDEVLEKEEVGGLGETAVGSAPEAGGATSADKAMGRIGAKPGGMRRREWLAVCWHVWAMAEGWQG